MQKDENNAPEIVHVISIQKHVIVFERYTDEKSRLY